MKIEDLAKLDRNQIEEEMLKAEMEGAAPEMIRDPFSKDKVIQDLRDVEKGNLEPELKKQLENQNKEAKSPFQESKEERTKDFVENPMMTLQEKYKALVDDYEKEQKKELKRPGVMDALPDILAGLYNIGVRANPTGLREMDMPNNVARVQKQAQEQRDRRLQNIDKTRSMLKDLMTLQGKTQGLTPYQRETLNLRKQELDFKKNKPKSEKEKSNLTEAEKVVDREFAKDYNKWVTGGKADYEVNSKIFKDAIKDLEKGAVDTGPVEGILARTPMIRTDARAMEDRVRKAINSMLRATLGAQFTEKEGERIFAQTFDPFKSSEDNIRAMKLELDKIEKRKDSIEDLSKYFGNKKTLSGYKPPSAKQETDLISDKDKQAIDWVKKNSDDPRAKKIIERLKRKGVL